MFPLIDIDGVSFQDTSGSLIVWNDYKLIINFINFSYNYLPIDNFNGYFLLSLITTTHTRSLPLLTLATLELSLSLSLQSCNLHPLRNLRLHPQPKSRLWILENKKL